MHTQNVVLPRRTLAIASVAAGLLLVLTGSGPFEAGELPSAPPPDRTTTCLVQAVRSATELTIRCNQEEHLLRLAGVYVPSGGPRDAAREFLERLIGGETVYVTRAPGDHEHDAGIPAPALVYRAPEGLLVNLELVRQGYARAVDPAPFAAVELLRTYERQARRVGKGIWSSGDAAAAPAEPTVPPPPAASQPAAPSDPTLVYVTPHGKKFHRADCQYLRGKGRGITLAEAQAKGYTPCARCWPAR